MSLPPDRFCNMVYVWLARGRESEEELAWLDGKLSEPFPWEEQQALATVDWDTDDGFMAAMQTLGKRG
jgi:hypothetical protein